MSAILNAIRQAGGAERSFDRAVDILDVAPKDFGYPKEWVNYVNSIEGRMKRTLESTQADDLCDSMFDADIDTAARKPKSSAAQQHAIHQGSLWRQARILAGRLSAIRSFRSNLLSSISELDDEIRQLESEKQF